MFTNGGTFYPTFRARHDFCSSMLYHTTHICSMYIIFTLFTYIWLRFIVNVGFSIHGVYGYMAICCWLICKKHSQPQEGWQHRTLNGEVLRQAIEVCGEQVPQGTKGNFSAKFRCPRIRLWVFPKIGVPPNHPF